MRRSLAASFAVAVFLSSLLGTAPTAVASKAMEWNVGKKVKVTINDSDTVTAIFQHNWKKCGSPSAESFVRKEGDYVYVRDSCKDGMSAVGFWRVTSGKQKGRLGVCQNSKGFGTWVRCNKDWPEGEKVAMTIAAGVYDGSEGGEPLIGHNESILFFNDQ